jgi:hypothetical protein
MSRILGTDPLNGQCIDGSVIPDFMSCGDSRWLSRSEKTGFRTSL